MHDQHGGHSIGPLCYLKRGAFPPQFSGGDTSRRQSHIRLFTNTLFQPNNMIFLRTFPRSFLAKTPDPEHGESPFDGLTLQTN